MVPVSTEGEACLAPTSGVIITILLLLASTASAQLALRSLRTGQLGDADHPIPPAAAESFVYEGAPRTISADPRGIRVEYDHSAIVFNAAGNIVQRTTFAQGFRPAPAAPPPAISCEFAGQAWAARQPPRFFQDLPRPNRGPFNASLTWSEVLAQLNAQSHLEGRRRYTMADGLPSNLVTHLAPAAGTLYIACADLYDPEKKAWTAGGLARFDPARDRFEPIEIPGAGPVRFVTLLQAAGDDLWVGFREGDGVAGDRIEFARRIAPETYRPIARRVCLARLRARQWELFAREPVADDAPSSEMPDSLIVSGERVFIHSTCRSPLPATGDWEVARDGLASLLDLRSKQWRPFDTAKDFDANSIRFLAAVAGQILAASDRGAHRWDGGRWQMLQAPSPLRNPSISAAAAVGNEIWVGYANQSFGLLGVQGITRIDEATGRWSHWTEEDLRTHCPVQSLWPRADGVWALFAPRMQAGPQAERLEYPREHSLALAGGVARWSDGRWEMPVKLDGVPDFFNEEYWDESGERLFSRRPLPLTHMAAVGDRLYVANRIGVYEGPGKWKSILEGDMLAIEPAPGGEALLALGTKYLHHTTGSPFGVMRYDPKTGQAERRELAQSTEAYAMLARRSIADPPRWSRQWVELPLGAPPVAVGPLEDAPHRVVLTPRNIWIISPGHLLRLDRAEVRSVQRPR